MEVLPCPPNYRSSASLFPPLPPLLWYRHRPSLPRTGSTALSNALTKRSAEFVQDLEGTTVLRLARRLAEGADLLAAHANLRRQLRVADDVRVT